MIPLTRPTKEQVRAWLQEQTRRHLPPPTPAQIREELGWAMLEAQRRGRV